MDTGKEACILCAWRENCQKKFSLSGRNIRCPDFVRDLSAKKDTPSKDEEDQQRK
jgi:hypothetical protein